MPVAEAIGRLPTSCQSFQNIRASFKAVRASLTMRSEAVSYLQSLVLSQSGGFGSDTG